MASILLAAGILSYESVKKTRAKRAEKRASHTSRFSELERENAARIARLQGQTCFCQTSDWRGGGCETHGDVLAAGEPGWPPPAPEYTEIDGGARVHTLGYEDATTGDGSTAPPTARRAPRGIYPEYRYRRGEEDGALAEKQGPPPPMPEDEVRRINEERRKRMKAGGFTNWVLRRKGRSNDGNAVVR